MNRKISKPYLTLAIAILLLLTIPRTTSENLRGFTMATFFPLWKIILQVYPLPTNFYSSSNDELQKLQIQNKFLAEENDKLKKLILNEKILAKRLRYLGEDANEALERHLDILKHNLLGQTAAIPAKVIFRSPMSWGSTLWVNVGSETNILLGHENISKNSPVILGNSIVGVIDYVGSKQSLVRLISDSSLVPSVRVARGGIYNQMISDDCAQLYERISQNDELFETVETKKECLQKIHAVLHLLEKKAKNKTTYLAKGEISGSSQSLWRSCGAVLNGIGFNYDFADDEGPARELSSSILKKNDLLITSGLDGVFPPGFYVAIVTEVKALQEGDYYYEIEATPTAGNLMDLSTVYILPSVGYDRSSNL